MKGRYIMGEVALCRERLCKWCVGVGLDIGYGGDPITKRAITIDVGDFHQKSSQNIIGDARYLKWFKDNSLDYVFSSHCIEDFVETAEVLKEWLRVIKPGGFFVLYAPDQKVYEKVCSEKGTLPNPGHKIPDFGLEYVKKVLENNFKGQYKIVHELPLVENYSFDLVLEKL